MQNTNTGILASPYLPSQIQPNHELPQYLNNL